MIDFGKFRVEPVTFTNQVKLDLGPYALLTYIEDIQLLHPCAPGVREDLHSFKRIHNNSAGNIRFVMRQTLMILMLTASGRLPLPCTQPTIPTQAQ
jgi:hypothetical protein